MTKIYFYTKVNVYIYKNRHVLITIRYVLASYDFDVVVVISEAMNCISVVVKFTLGIKDLFVDESYELFLNRRDKFLVCEVIPHVNNL